MSEVNNVEEAEHAFLFALLLEYESDSTDYVPLSTMHSKYQFKFPESWLESLVSEWEDLDWVHVSRTHSGTSAIINRARYSAVLKRVMSWLDATSLTIDARKEEILSDSSPSEKVPIPNGWKWFTFESDKKSSLSLHASTATSATHHVIAIDKDSADFRKVQADLAALAEQVRGANDVPDRERILAGISAAETIWASASFRVIQIKVGVLLAIEDAAAALGTLGRGVSAGLLTDLVKSIIKNKTGIDLDNL